jgi:hypothetical protein
VPAVDSPNFRPARPPRLVSGTSTSMGGFPFRECGSGVSNRYNLDYNQQQQPVTRATSNQVQTKTQNQSRRAASPPGGGGAAAAAAACRLQDQLLRDQRGQRQAAVLVLATVRPAPPPGP